MDSSSYAPQSPDLSSFLPSKPQQSPPHLALSPPHQHHHLQHQTQHHRQLPDDSQSYTPRSPTLPFNLPETPFQGQHQFQLHQKPHDDQHQHQRPFALGGERRFSEYADNSQYMPPIPTLPPAQTTTSEYYSREQQHLQDYQSLPIKAEPSYNPYDSITTVDSMSRASRAIKPDPSLTFPTAPSASNKAPPPAVDIRTKFPVARIKRIMQADEEVGKVAQVTPVAVNKALELFMTALVLGAAERAKEKGGKRITAAHLKSVVESDEQFDFLNDIVGRVQDAPEGGAGKRKGGRGGDSDSDDDSGERKVKKGKGRRKKSEG